MLRENQEGDSEDINEAIPEFARTGGNILEYYKDGRPKTWICGKNAEGEPTDPEGVDPKDVVRRLNRDGVWEGANPAKEDVDEIKTWRSDWMNFTRKKQH